MGVLYRRRRDALVHRYLPTLLVQGTAMEVALDGSVALWTAGSGMVGVVGALRSVDVDGGALQRARLLRQAMGLLNVVVVYHSDLGTCVTGLRRWVHVVDEGFLLAGRGLDHQRRPLAG